MSKYEVLSNIQSHYEELLLNHSLYFVRYFFDSEKIHYGEYTCYEIDTNYPLNAVYIDTCFSDVKCTFFFDRDNICVSVSCY